MNFFRKLFKKKESLRDKCIAAYGKEFGELYDAINRGEAIGGFLETCVFLDMVEAIKEGKEYSPKDYNYTYPKVTGAFIPGQNGEPDVNVTIDENGKMTKTFI